MAGLRCPRVVYIAAKKDETVRIVSATYRGEGMDALTLVTLAAVVWKIVEVVKNGIAGAWGKVMTQLVVWAAGIGVAFLAAQSDIAGEIEVWDTTLGRLDSASLLLLGVGLSSVSGVGYETKKALDSSDSAKQESIFSGFDA